MAEKFASERNLKFLLYEVHDIEALTKLPYYREHNREIFDLVLDTAFKLGRDLLYPSFSEMDKKPPEFAGGTCRVHPSVRAFMEACGEGGWIGAAAPVELGGQELPLTLMSAVRFVFTAANYSLSIYPLLTTGAAHLIEAFGSPEMIETYIPNMFAGKWQGTMALTEPQAGSSLADIVTMAEPTEAGYYKLKGQKIFISAGDHDGVDNVIHLMLAKIKGAPAGVRGISLFVVPKLRLDESGSLVPNDVVLAGIYHKLGYRGAPITQLSLGENDDCRGWLVGQPHQGLPYMFQMMNEARLDVGMSAAGIASAAYYASLEYAKERLQGRKLTSKDPTLPQVPIIEHPDIKRLLLFQRSVFEGALSLILKCDLYGDLARLGGEAGEKYALLLDLLTPVAKTYPSEMGVLSTSAGLQILGGYGYCDEFPLEQYFRDSRIHPIHEGTTGIHGLDLLGRKVTIKSGRAYQLFLAEVEETIRQVGGQKGLSDLVGKMDEALSLLKRVTDSLLGVAAKGDTERFLADATVYLEFFSLVAVGWQWLVQAAAAARALEKGAQGQEAAFYRGKLVTARFFFGYELCKTEGLAKRLTEADGLTVSAGLEAFTD
jgi:alkylation response protein AidB-like acyl-CoA dehydrogenase